MLSSVREVWLSVRSLCLDQGKLLAGTFAIASVLLPAISASNWLSHRDQRLEHLPVNRNPVQHVNFLMLQCTADPI